MTGFHKPDYDAEYTTPGSPPLPAPDSEVRLPERPLSDDEMGFLDLNPGLDGTTADTATDTCHKHRLSITQQSKFINYVDEQLLEINRMFIKTLGMNQYSAGEIIARLQQLVEFIWLSIPGKDDPRCLFGQTDYLLTIAGDLLEFVDKLNIHGVCSEVLELLQSLDTKFTQLLPAMKQTEVVRLVSIAERTRPLVVVAFERAQIEGFHAELAKVYEQVLEAV